MTDTTHLTVAGLYLLSENRYSLYDQTVITFTLTCMSVHMSVFCFFHYHCTSRAMHNPKCKCHPIVSIPVSH